MIKFIKIGDDLVSVEYFKSMIKHVSSKNGKPFFEIRLFYNYEDGFRKLQYESEELRDEVFNLIQEKLIDLEIIKVF